MSRNKDTLIVKGIDSKGFGKIPKLVMQDTDLSIEAKGIYAYFASYAGAGETAFPSVSKTIHDLKIGRNRYYKHRKQLEAKGYIEIERVRDGKGDFERNIYTLSNEVACIQNADMQNADTQNADMQNEYTNNNNSNNNSIKKNKDNTSVGEAQIPYKKIIDYLNEKTNKDIKHTARGNRKLISARWNEGYKLEDFKKVIDNKVDEWFGKGIIFSNGKDAETYLHPTTLFNGNNFDKYLNQPTRKPKEDINDPNRYIPKELREKENVSETHRAVNEEHDGESSLESELDGFI